MAKKISEIYFWQNSISPHQAGVIRNFVEISKIKVYWVAKASLDKERIQMGWQEPDTTGINVITNPAKSDIIQLITQSSSNSLHIFSGPRGIPILYFGFKQALKNDRMVGLLGETYNTKGIKGSMRYLRGRYDYLLFGKYVRLIYAIGKQSPHWYKKCGYDKKIIFDWGYFPENFNIPLTIHKNNIYTILYVGKIKKTKGLEDLIKASFYLKNAGMNFKLVIIGNGEFKDKLKMYSNSFKLNSVVTFKDFMQNNEVQEKISNSDLLVLPSKAKEGWGAVINEALNLGTRVLCSSLCGASVLIDKSNGSVFKAGNLDDLKEKLEENIEFGPIDFVQRETISKKYNDLSLDKIANYMKLMVQYVESDYNKEKPKAPWL